MGYTAKNCRTCGGIFTAHEKIKYCCANCMLSNQRFNAPPAPGVNHASLKALPGINIDRVHRR